MWDHLNELFAGEGVVPEHDVADPASQAGEDREPRSELFVHRQCLCSVHLDPTRKSTSW